MLIKSCEACNQTFVCKAEDIALCTCSQVVLTQLEREYIAKQYSNCICNTCLLHLKDEFLARK